MSGSIKRAHQVDAICDNHEAQRREYWQRKGNGTERRWVLLVARPAGALRSTIPFGTFEAEPGRAA